MTYSFRSSEKKKKSNRNVKQNCKCIQKHTQNIFKKKIEFSRILLCVLAITFIYIYFQNVTQIKIVVVFFFHFIFNLIFNFYLFAKKNIF